MSNSFDVNQYWLKRGQTYISEEQRPLEYHALQERFLFEVLRRGSLPMGKVLELGCGFGRVTRLLAQHYPEAQITALDLSSDQLTQARQHCAGQTRINFEQYDFYSGQPFPGGKYDCSIAIEVFLHHPEPVIRDLIARLHAISTHILNIDWSERWPWPTPPHVWVHDYPALYRDSGLKCAVFTLPVRVEGKQQRLFVAGQALPAELLALEQELQRQALSEPQPAHGDSWIEALELARQEIVKLIPAGSRFILVDDDQWGDAQLFPDRRVIPFLEREGQYWGPPADDATALSELERLRLAGADYIVFAWSAFWWLEHYAGLRQHLQNSFPCVVHSDLLAVFRLKSKTQG